MRKKGFKKAVGHFFFDIKMGYQNTITISRQTKGDAIYAYTNYLNQGKECVWLGQWNGKKFDHDKFDELAA